MLNVVRYRLLNQCIAGTRCERPGQVVSWLGAVQAQDYLGSLWAVGSRTEGATEETVERAIAGREIVRTWPMRGTLHFVDAADVRWMLALLAPRVLARSARRSRQLGLDDAAFARSREVFAGALRGGRQLTRDELYGLLEGAGISTAGQRGYHLLWRAAQEGLVCLGARSGKQHTFALLDEWVPASRPLARDEALAGLALRYFTGHGPATLHDFVWWSGLATADARAGLEMAKPRLMREAVDGRDFWLPPGGVAEIGASPRAWLLPAFDEYLVGYRDRSAVLDPSQVKRINAGGGMLDPVVVVDGRVVGVWKRTLRKDAVLVKATLFSVVSRVEASAVEAAADRYGRFLGIPARLSFEQKF